jgi:hypothetical protein
MNAAMSQCQRRQSPKHRYSMSRNFFRNLKRPSPPPHDKSFFFFVAIRLCQWDPKAVDGLDDHEQNVPRFV